MNNQLIKPKSFSVGYNLTGQDFFDTISLFDEYIDSYFFSFNREPRGDKLNATDIFNVLKKCNRYGIRGNLLLNNYEAENNYEEYLKMAMDIGDVSAVTVITPEIISKIKDKYPDLEIHISVRYFDWINNKSDLLSNEKNSIIKLADCGVNVVNISGEYHFNNDNIINLIHEYGMKTKIIINEGCIFRREFNYNNFEEFKNLSCKGDNGCNYSCYDVYDKYPWVKLSRISLFKEDLLYHDYDILKIASRKITNEDIYAFLYKFIIDPRTFMLHNIPITDSNYDIFIEWIKNRSNCPGNCFSCRKCEEYYNKLIK